MILSHDLHTLGAGVTLCVFAAGWAAPAAAQTELKIGYMKHPIHEANVAIMEKWARPTTSSSPRSRWPTTSFRRR
jgi:hypothetical protein